MIKRGAISAASLMVFAGLSASAQAQSSVNISGYLDIGVFRDFDKVTKVGSMARSNIAFSGTEDLGGGMATTFKLSHRMELDTGAPEGVGFKPFWHGEATVGLKGAFGHVRLGRALDAISNNDWAFDPWGNFNRVASPAWNFWHWNYATSRTSNTGTAEFGRLNNGVFYDSPNMGGFAVHLSGATEQETVAGAGTGNNFGASLNYDKGPIAAMLAHSKNSSGDKVTFLGGKFTTGPVQLMAAYDVSIFNAPVDSKAKVITLGAVYTAGATSFKAGLGRLDVDGAKTNFVGLGVDYALSKRTTVYASAGHRDPRVGATARAFGVGIGHSF